MATLSDPPLSSDVLVSTSGERTVLEAFLDLYRDIVVKKVAVLSAEVAHRRLVPSATTLAGLLCHLTSVEREWFHAILGQRPPTEAGVRVADDGWGVGSEAKHRRASRGLPTGLRRLPTAGGSVLAG